jgi:tyrosinase
METNGRGWLFLVAGLSLLPFPSCLQTNADGGAQESSTRVIATAGPIELETVPQRVSFAMSPGKVLATDQPVYLVLHDLQATEQPGVLYHLYLDLPPGVTPEQDDARYIGTFNFYDAIPIDAGERKKTATQSSGFFSYDISGVARTLRGRGMLSERTTVTIRAGGTPTPGAKPVIGRIELVRQ